MTRLPAIENNRPRANEAARPIRARTRCADTSDETRQSYALPSVDTPAAAPCAVSHLGTDVELTLRQGGHAIFEGRWHGQLNLQGREFTPQTPWENVCTETNDEAAYIELKCQLDEGFEVERQVFLARRDEFAFLADVVRGPSTAQGEYRMHLPLPTECQWVPSADTHEGLIRADRKRIASVIPVCLPEWRTERGGNLLAESNQLVLSIPFQVRSHAALFVDLAPQRHRRTLTWRRLTVGEKLAILPRHVAAGYRVQIGRSQWLIYRSLSKAANRSVLGQNIITEFVVARFLPNGTIERLLDIE